MTDIRKALQNALQNENFVHLTLENGAHEGFVIAIGLRLVLLQAVYEYQDVGALVMPIDQIEVCEVSEFHDEQLKILAFVSVKRTKRYGWVRIGSFVELFKSLKLKNRFVVISHEDEADVGYIDTIGTDSVELRAVDPGGNWIEDMLDYAYDDIEFVQFDDNYSRVLQRYAERTPALN